MGAFEFSIAQHPYLHQEKNFAFNGKSSRSSQES